MHYSSQNRCTRRVQRHLKAALAVAVLMASPAAFAVEFQAGDWTIDVGGFINAYYTTVECKGDPVGGLALAGEALGCGGSDSRTTIGNGLLPNALVTKFSTEQNGYDIGGTLSIMAHTATSSAIAPNSGVDVRQAFFTIGNADIGTFKLGRDYGVFGSGAILGDMTLLGVGMPIQATQRGRVSLGHIGAGYSYLGHYGQLAWSSPGSSGFGVTAALISPVDNGLAHQSGSAPQVQAQLKWSSDALNVWLGGKMQKFEAIDPAVSDDFTMRGLELGASGALGAFSWLASVQSGRGLGILSDGDQEDTRSTNWLAQGRFAVTEKLDFGLNYGISRNKDATPVTGGLKSNANATAGAYYQITPAVTLVMELAQTRSKSFDGDTAKMNGVSLGGIVFF